MKYLLPILCVPLLLFSGEIMQTPVCTEQRPKVVPVLLSPEGERKADAMAQFAVFAAGQKDAGSMGSLIRALDKDPFSSELIALTSMLMIQLQSPEFTERVTAVVKEHPESPLLFRIAAAGLDVMGERDRAQELLTVFTRYAERHDFPQEQCREAARALAFSADLLLRSEKIAEADRLLETFSGRKGLADDPYLLQIELLYCEKAAALLPEKRKTDLFSWLKKDPAEALKQRRERAETAFLSRLKKDGDDWNAEDFRRSTAYFLKKGDRAAALSIPAAGLRKKPVPVGTYRELAEFYKISGEPEKEIRYREKVLESSDGKDNRLQYADALFRGKRYRESAEEMEKILHSGEWNNGLLVRTSMAWSLAGEWKKSVALLEKLPPSRLRYKLTASVLWKHKQYKSALAPALKILEYTVPGKVSAKELRETALFVSAIAEKSGRTDIVRRQIESVLPLFPKDALLLNFLGYTLADSGVDLPRAEELIRRALKEEPENAAYLDSMAWVCYRRKRYQEAETWILRSLARSPKGKEDAVILDHAGDIMAVLGKKDRARDYWERALKADSDELQDRKSILKKLGE